MHGLEGKWTSPFCEHGLRIFQLPIFSSTRVIYVCNLHSSKYIGDWGKKSIFYMKILTSGVGGFDSAAMKKFQSKCRFFFGQIGWSTLRICGR